MSKAQNQGFVQAELFEQEFLPPVVRTKYLTASSWGMRFLEFHRANPHVYDNLIRIAMELKGQGVKRTSIDLIYHQLRWRYGIQTKSDSFRLNNNYTAFYSRMIMAHVPALRDFFETRRGPRQQEQIIKELVESGAFKRGTIWR